MACRYDAIKFKGKFETKRYFDCQDQEPQRQSNRHEADTQISLSKEKQQIQMLCFKQMIRSLHLILDSI